MEVTADLDRVKTRADGCLVADHVRAWARSTTVTDPVHLQTARRLRNDYRKPGAAGEPDDLSRDLADYDRAFGLGTADGQVA